MTKSVDMDLFEASGFYQVKNSKIIQEDNKSVTIEADIKGDIKHLEGIITEDLGKKVILVKRNSSL